MTGASLAIRAEGLSVAIKKAPLLTDIDLKVEVGEWVSVIGPNGAGKSTLLRAVAGVLSATGNVEIAGQSVASMGAKERARAIAWVPQTPTIPVGISVFDYVLLGRTPYLATLARESAEDLSIVADVLEELDLTRLGQRMVDSLSGGELQRAVIGRALAQQTPVILLDEPTSALDLGHQQEVLELLERLRATGERTIVTTMHDLTLAGVFADRLVMLACGEVVADGPADVVLTKDHLERYYGANVRVTREGGHVVVTPVLPDRTS